MAKKKKEKKGKISKKEELKKNRIWRPDLQEKTRRIIAGVICLGIAAILILSFFNLSGILGSYIYRAFHYLFGWLYFLSPLFFLVAGAIFISSLRKNIYASTLLGLIFFAVGALGISDILKSNSAGLIGRGAGAVEKLLSFWGGMVFEAVLVLVGLIIIFEFSLNSFKEKSSQKEKEEDLKEDDFYEEEAPLLADKNKTEEKEEKKEASQSIISKLRGKKKDEKRDEKKEKEEESVFAKSAEDKAKKLNKKVLENWNFPSLDILESDSGKPLSGDIKTNSQIIKRTLNNFGIAVEMGEISVGPTVTRYTLKPAEGMKLSKIVALHNDLSLALAAHPIRIEAPIPGKSLVGIEVPNKIKTQVRLKNLLSLKEFSDSDLLAVPLGRDVSGAPVFMDVCKMPHLLVAGSTGSGKSVAIHTIIASFLFKNTPETLRMLMIDPKRVELTVYNHLPHLISDVITKPKKAIAALRWAVLEMDKRYDELEEAKSRNIGTYNEKMLKKNKPLMSYIVIIIDELADLMATYGREVEASIVRLAQMARATGIHLIVSTQRPSTEVITGLIKANIPARIALKVASQIDSRTILDMAGAEKLVGQGDLLFLAAETSKPRRVQGAFVSEGEVARLSKFIAESNKDYISENEEIEDFSDVAQSDSRLSGSQIDFDSVPGLGDDDDDLYPEAYKIVVESQKASTSFLQRRLRVGYARAARLMDILEERGVISPGEGAKPRDVLVSQNNDRMNIEDDIPEDKPDSFPKQISGIEGEEVLDLDEEGE